MLTAAYGERSPQHGEAIAGLRAREFARLDETGTAYLDYTGAALYPESIVRRDMARLGATVFGNPHAESSSSRASSAALHEARALTLQLFDADPAHYDVIFTANASRAIAVLAEAFPFGRRSRLVMTDDNHNSVNGLRVGARRRGATVAYVGLDRELRSLDPEALLPVVSGPSLFAFPAQSNFSGVRHPLAWVSQAQRRGYRVLLDAAAFAATSGLSLAAVPADFVAISYYKLFGYPTGVGALVARRDALATLRRRFFAGGTVQFVSVQNDVVRSRPGGEGFEDGTSNFLAMPAVCDGLHWLATLGMPAIERHIAGLTAELLQRLTALGDRVAIYGPHSTQQRGGTVAFNLQRNGRTLPYELVETAARRHGLAIRGGCFCNPGAAERAFDQPAGRAWTCLRGPFSIARFRSCLDGPPVGALRASVGVPTTSADLARLIDCAVALAD
jgi:selenocysteine lyase/cysteine desulfurase